MVGKKDLDLESKQLEAMEALYSGKDVFLLLPTGSGKSICYECLPFLYDYKLHLTATPSQRTTVLVISPLVSLMINQVVNLKRRGVSAAILSGNQGIKQSLQAGSLESGEHSLVFTAPEAIINSTKWQRCMLDLSVCGRVVAVAVDEAHCVSRWSRSFRGS